MNSRYRRVYEMAQRAASFINTNAGAFVAVPIVLTHLANLRANAETLAQLGVEKVTQTGAAQQSSIARGDARDELDDQLQDVADLWKSMADEIDAGARSFRMPGNKTDQNLLSTARSFLAEAAPIKAEFTKRGLPADFLEQLAGAAGDFEDSIGESEDARRTRAGANAGFIEPARNCMRIVEKLNPIVRVVFRRNPQKTAEWLIASHVERAAKSKKDKPGKAPEDQ